MWRALVTIIASGVVCALVWWASALLAASALVDRAATCVADHCFCERVAGFPEQLANSVSSFAFVVLGVWMLVGARPARGTPERTLFPLLAATMLFLGATSFFYHATLSFFGQFLDVLSMYVFGLLLFYGALYRSGRLRGSSAVAGFVILIVGFGVLQYAFPDARRILFAALLLPGIILELTPFVTGLRLWSRKLWAILMGLVAMVTAFLIWIADQFPAFCQADSLVQGHAIWHVLTAIAVFLVSVHYRLTAHEPGVNDRALTTVR